MTNQEVAALARAVYTMAGGEHDDRVTAVYRALCEAGVRDLTIDRRSGRTLLVRRSELGGSTPVCQLVKRGASIAEAPPTIHEGDSWTSAKEASSRAARTVKISTRRSRRRSGG